MRLDIVVAPGCSGCDEARVVAPTLREQFPALHVEVIELDGRRPPPDGVVATPTYLLDGAVVSLGNPRAADLIGMIRRRASALASTQPARSRWHLPWKPRTAQAAPARRRG